MLSLVHSDFIRYWIYLHAEFSPFCDPLPTHLPVCPNILPYHCTKLVHVYPSHDLQLYTSNALLLKIPGHDLELCLHLTTTDVLERPHLKVYLVVKYRKWCLQNTDRWIIVSARCDLDWQLIWFALSTCMRSGGQFHILRDILICIIISGISTSWWVVSIYSATQNH